MRHAFRFLACAILVVSAPAPAAAEDFARFRNFDAASAAVVDHSKWAAFLKAYVVEGTSGPNLVRYAAAASADKQALAAYVVIADRRK